MDKNCLHLPSHFCYNDSVPVTCLSREDNQKELSLTMVHNSSLRNLNPFCKTDSLSTGSQRCTTRKRMGELSDFNRGLKETCSLLTSRGNTGKHLQRTFFKHTGQSDMPQHSDHLLTYFTGERCAPSCTEYLLCRCQSPTHHYTTTQHSQYKRSRTSTRHTPTNALEERM